MDLTSLPHQLNKRSLTVRAVIECPRGGRWKYTYEPQLETFEPTRLLPVGMAFPLDFGFIPSTRAEDGDPLDVLVVADEPLAIGAAPLVRLIGVLEAEQTVEGKTYRNDRLIGVAVHSWAYAKLRDVAELGEAFAEQLTSFWVAYNTLRGRTFKPLALRKGAAAAGIVGRHATEG